MSPSELPSTLKLESHPFARDKCTSLATFSPGSRVLSIPVLVTLLLPSEKGYRCDLCARRSPSQSLKRCTGCASYWYCDATCQSIDWKAGHRKICKFYSSYIASSQYQGLEPHEKMDALLLSTLCAYISGLEIDQSSDMTTFLSLLPGPVDVEPPLLCGNYSSVSRDQLKSFYTRFGNNNFSMHSHFNVFGHGIFPLASRLFNHSCIPNAAAKYILSPAEHVRMEIVALRQISRGEEICIPYLDPALLQTRTQVFQLSYGFTCRCPSCAFLGSIGHIAEPPKDAKELRKVSKELEQFVQDVGDNSPLRTGRTDGFPSRLRCVLHETFLGDLSEKFSATSHEGPYDIALEAGTILTALHRLIYPQNYPQIGMHLLELAKTVWNHWIQTDSADESLKNRAREALRSASAILTVYGPEGDEYDSPLVETQTLGRLLSMTV